MDDRSAADTVFGDNLRKLRISHSMNQTAMADRLGVSRTTVSHYEKGIARPTDAILMKIYKEFGYTPSDMLGQESDLDKPAKDLFEHIRRERMRRGMNIIELAELAEVSPSTIGRIERGVQIPSLSLVERIADILDIPDDVYRPHFDEHKQYRPLVGMEASFGSPPPPPQPKPEPEPQELNEYLDFIEATIQEVSCMKRDHREKAVAMFMNLIDQLRMISDDPAA